MNKTRMNGKNRIVGTLPLAWKIALILMPVLAAMIALQFGRYMITPGEFFTSLGAMLTGQPSGLHQVDIVLWTTRFPRILLALLVGAGLSVAGCAFQSLFSNPLATPDTLGVASGASFGAALAILVGFNLIMIQLSAFAFGILATALTWLAGSGRKKGVNSVVLAGIMIGSLFSALVSLVKFAADTEDQLPAITYWLMGSLSGAGYKNLLFWAVPIILGMAVLYLMRWRLNILPLSDDEIKASGVNITVLRGITIVCAAGITASCISMCGQVGWVGLLIPHICRMKFGSNHLSTIPASISIGATFMVIVDTIARSAVAQEIPISILTAIIGAPFFIYLMRRSEGWHL